MRGRSLSDKLVVVALLAIAGFAIFLGSRALFGEDDGYRVRFEMADAGGVLKNYNVKIGQVPAGQVKKISLDEDDTVIMEAILDEGAAPIGEGATANVRPVNLLGEKYIDINPGDLSKPLPSGSTIPKERTGQPIELDDAFNMLDPDTRAAMRIIFNEAGVAMLGRGTDFNKILTELPPALDEMTGVVDEVRDENAQLRVAINEGDTLLAALVNKKDDLGEFVEAAGDTFETLAQRRPQLGATVQSAPGGFRQLTTTLRQLQDASVSLTPAVQDLRTSAPFLAETLQGVPDFTASAKDALRVADQVSPTLSRLATQSLPTLRRLQPTAQRMRRFLNDFQPFVTTLDDQKGLKDFMGFMDGWAGVTSDTDGLGHNFRLRINVDEEFVASALRRYAAGFAPTRKASRKRGAPQQTGSTPPASKPGVLPSVGAPSDEPARLPNILQQVNDRLTGVGKATEGLVGGLQQGKVDAQPLLDLLLKP